MKNRFFCINKNTVVLLICMFSVITPYKLGYVNGLKECLNICQIFVCLITGLNVLYNDNVKNKSIIYLFAVYEVVLLTATIVGKQDLYAYFANALNRWSFIFLCCYGFTCKKYWFIKTLYTFFYILIVWNFISLVNGALIHGMEADEFVIINTANSVSIYYIFAGVIFILHDYMYEKKITKKSISAIVLMAISELIVWSATGMIGFFLFIVMIIIYVIENREEWEIPIWTITIVIMISGIMIVVFQKIPIFSNFIESVLHKSLTFTGRNIIWSKTITAIIRSPIIGYGFGFYAYNSFFAHNTILEILIEGGLLLLSVFSVIFVYCIRKGKDVARSAENRRFSNLVAGAIVASEMMMITEMPSFSFFFVLLYMFSSIENIVNIGK